MVINVFLTRDSIILITEVLPAGLGLLEPT